MCAYTPGKVRLTHTDFVKKHLVYFKDFLSFVPRALDHAIQWDGNFLLKKMHGLPIIPSLSKNKSTLCS